MKRTEDDSSVEIKYELEYDKNGDCVSAEQPLSNYLFRINIDPNNMEWKMKYPPMCNYNPQFKNQKQDIS